MLKGKSNFTITLSNQIKGNSLNLEQTILSIDFFKVLTQEQLSKLLEFSNIKSYAKNSILHYENESSNSLLFLIEGLLKVYKIDKYDNEIFLYNIYEKSMISEVSSFNQNEILCFSNAEFTRDSKILSINFEKFNEHFLSQNILTKEFLNELLKKTHQLQCVLNRELVFDATAKVAFMLYHDLEIFNSLKRQEVSFMLHIQPETLSRVLKRLKRNNIIEINSSTVTILDKPQLSGIFTGVSV